MGMLGNQLAPGTQFAVTNDSYNGDGSTTAFTLSQSVSATTDIEVIVDNVQQSPHDSSYSVSGTALTFSEAPATGTNNIYVIYHGSKHHTTTQVIPDNGSVTHSKFHTTALNPITLDPTNDRVGINSTSPSVSLEIGATQQREEIRLSSTGGGAQAVLGTYAGAESYVGSTNNVPLHFRTNGTNRAQIDTNGRYLNSNQPAFRVGKTSGQQGSGGSYIDPVSFQTSYFNIGNHFNLSTDKFTAPVAGRYMFGWMLGMYRYSATWMGIYSYVNNSFLAHTQTFNYSAPSWINFDGSVLVQLQANDTFHIVGRHDSNAGIDNSGCFWGYLVG